MTNSSEARTKPGRSRRRKRDAKDADSRPVFEGEVTDLDHEGRGVLRHDGKVVFVDAALPGERIRFRTRRRKRSYDEGILLEVLEASPHRVQPPCQHADLCGGCRLQHFDLEGQREYKARRLHADLEHIGGVKAATVLDTLFAPDLGYRRKARLGVRYVPAKGGVVVGFRERYAPYVADLRRCEVLVPAFGTLIGRLREVLGALTIRDRVPQIEVASGEGRLVLVIRHLDPLSDADRRLLTEFSEAEALQILLQPGGMETIAPLVHGTDSTLEYRLPGLGLRGQDLNFQFGPTDFIQVNEQINTALVARALELLAPGPGLRVLDLFCGLGNFSLPVAVAGSAVLGVEGEKQLVEGARLNARRNDIRNAKFEVGDLFQPVVAQKYGRLGFERVLLDPPRSGALEWVQALQEPYPERIVYVSCNSSTLARDAAVLTGSKPYELAAAGLVDMFPHTTHAEAVTLFMRK